MANINYIALLSEVLPNLKADPSEPVALAAIRAVVIEFCAGSRVWQFYPTPMSVRAGVATYDLDPEVGSDVAMVMSANLDGTDLTDTTPDWLDASDPLWRTVPGTPRYYTQLDTEQIILAPAPDTTQSRVLATRLALQPSRASTGFPKWILNQHQDAIADGATARLMLMPDKAWTDLSNGKDRRNRFKNHMDNVRALGAAGMTRAPIRTTSQH